MKPQYILYTAKAFQTGLSDVKAVIRRNGVQVANNVSLTAASSLEAGVYQLMLSTSTLGTYGGAGFYDFYIDSTSKPAPAVTFRVVTQNDEDDNASAINAVSAIVTDIQSKVNNGTYGLAAIESIVASIQSTVAGDAAALAAIQGTGFVSSADSLKAISDRIYNGGDAI